MIRVERVTEVLPLDFDALLAEAHAEGFGMLDVLADDRGCSKEPV